ncbi:maternal effect embryo arrest 60 [Euphorbia peplus]|nr:maternal effect embryo arrest 60 [Euphorbia peplus]
MLPQLSRAHKLTTQIHIMALDGIVNVNSLFTLALFLGLAWYPIISPSTSLISDPSCIATPSIGEELISFHVYSFSFFLSSSLIALALKQAIKIADKDGDNVVTVEEVGSVGLVHVNMVALRVGTLVSGFGSVFGCGFLMMALVDLVQIKLGVLGCGSFYTVAAIVPLVVLVPSALVIYVFLMLYSFAR